MEATEYSSNEKNISVNVDIVEDEEKKGQHSSIKITKIIKFLQEGFSKLFMSS